MAEAISSWGRVDLVPVHRGKRTERPPTLLERTDGLHPLYRGKLHVYSSEPESGKGWLAIFAAAERLRAAERSSISTSRTTSERRGDFCADPPPCRIYAELWLTRVDGSGQRLLKGPGPNARRSWYSYFGGEFNPAGGRIACTRTDLSAAIPDRRDLGYAPGWSGTRLLVHNGEFTDYSPGGDHLLFVRTVRSDEGRSLRQDIYLARSNGSHVRRIIRGGGDSAEFSPNGRRIVFLKVFSQLPYRYEEDLFTAKLDGTEQRRITPAGDSATTTLSAPDWGVRGTLP